MKPAYKSTTTLAAIRAASPCESAREAAREAAWAAAWDARESRLRKMLNDVA